MRLIDADALVDDYNKNSNRHDKSKFGDVSYEDFFDAVIYDVSHAPTVDAEPVKHGHWTECKDRHSWECSVCHTWSVVGGHYCDWCGAKMDEVEE